ncbi:hypothetical protein VTP01DRAFT_8271 [Rhizomucor pusillus]|uniref:uncharacterized protein n=1 Tax=Rhizomucor pusillus TaxID=4840 RepID=UPI003743C445
MEGALGSLPILTKGKVGTSIGRRKTNGQMGVPREFLQDGQASNGGYGTATDGITRMGFGPSCLMSRK